MPPKIVDEQIDREVRDWFLKNRRHLPWRVNKSAYSVWISEIMLQQTQVAKVVDYYERFLQRFPGVAELAQASEDEILGLWSGLGYYSRARNLHACAKKIVAEHDSQFPNNLEDIIALPGIGSYTAGAIVSFAFGNAAAVVDGNIVRVLSRFFADPTDFATNSGRKHFEAVSLSLAKQSKQPGMLQEGLMELGALVCRPHNPDCQSCPLSQRCASKASRDQLLYPKKKSPAKKQEIHGVFAILGDESSVWLEKNSNGNLFKGLYAPPHLFLENRTLEQTLDQLSRRIGVSLLSSSSVKVTRTLTHRIFHMYGFSAYINPLDFPHGKFVGRKKLDSIGMSSATKTLLERMLPDLDRVV